MNRTIRLSKEKEIKELREKLETIRELAKSYLDVGLLPMQHILNVLDK